MATALYTPEISRPIRRTRTYRRPRAVRKLTPHSSSSFTATKDTQAIYYEAGKQHERSRWRMLRTWRNHDTHTEGMSYGMMIAVQLDKNTSSTRSGTGRTHTAVTDPKGTRRFGYFAWSMNVDGTPRLRIRLLRTAKNISPWRCISPRTAGQRNRHLQLQGTSGPHPESDEASRCADRHAAVPHHPNDEPFVRKPRPLRLELLLPPTSPAGSHRRPDDRRDVQDHPIRTGLRRRRNAQTLSYHLPAFYELWARWGPVAGPRVLVRGRGREPRHLRKGYGTGDRAYAGPQPLRRFADDWRNRSPRLSAMIHGAA